MHNTTPTDETTERGEKTRTGDAARASETTRTGETTETDETTPALGRSVLSDEALLEKAHDAENGRKFAALYGEGWDSRGVRRLYERERHAELALLVHLLWWSRHDTEQVKRLFDASALCSEAWDRYPMYYGELLRSAKMFLGDACYDPDHLDDDE